MSVLMRLNVKVCLRFFLHACVCACVSIFLFCILVCSSTFFVCVFVRWCAYVFPFICVDMFLRVFV